MQQCGTCALSSRVSSRNEVRNVRITRGQRCPYEAVGAQEERAGDPNDEAVGACIDGRDKRLEAARGRVLRRAVLRQAGAVGGLRTAPSSSRSSLSAQMLAEVMSGSSAHSVA